MIEEKLCDLLTEAYSQLSAPDELPHKKERIIQSPGALMHLGILSHIDEMKGENHDRHPAIQQAVFAEP